MFDNYDYGKIIELNEKGVPKEYKYKTPRQKCYAVSCKCGIFMLALVAYGLTFGLGYHCGKLDGEYGNHTCV
tara:strand:- start:38 stop:253 length:216 start_codon:yes stop_codon:yes gene_type:complete